MKISQTLPSRVIQNNLEKFFTEYVLMESAVRVSTPILVTYEAVVLLYIVTNKEP
jgi:hypothetical protein